jgi:hypothetical protein
VADVAEVLRSVPLGAGTVAELARRTGAKRMLHLGLWLAHELLAADLPAHLAAAVEADAAAVRLATRIAERFRLRPHHWLGPLEEPRFHLAMREHWRDRVRYGLGMLAPTSADWRVVRLPEWLSFLYYMVRPVRLIAQHGFSLRSKS